jgi:hypothetical protein
MYASGATEPLPGLDGGPAEDDPPHRAGEQGLDGASHGEIGLAGARRTDSEDERVLPHRVDVALLTVCLGAHDATTTDLDGLGEDPRR